MLNKMRKILLFLTATLITACSGGGGGGSAPAVATNPSATLQWTTPVVYIDNTPVDVAGFKVYYGTEPGHYTATLNVGKVNSYTVQNLTANTTYYFVVTAYDADGVESDPTDEQSKTL
jgi:fibronectin type 3 domain-containing protein